MTAAQAPELTHEMLAGIVRGAVTWRVLERFGVRADLDRLPATFHQPGGLPVIQVTVDDLRAGFSSCRDDAIGLRQWAQIALMCDCFDFAPVEDDPVGDLVVTALWDLAYGDEPAPAALAALRRAQGGRAAGDGSEAA